MQRTSSFLSDEPMQRCTLRQVRACVTDVFSLLDHASGVPQFRIHVKHIGSDGSQEKERWVYAILRSASPPDRTQATVAALEEGVARTSLHLRQARVDDGAAGDFSKRHLKRNSSWYDASEALVRGSKPVCVVAVRCAAKSGGVRGCWGRFQSPMPSVRTQRAFRARDVRLRSLGDLTDFLFLHLCPGVHVLRMWDTLHRLLAKAVPVPGLRESVDENCRLCLLASPALRHTSTLDEARIVFCAENAQTGRRLVIEVAPDLSLRMHPAQEYSAEAEHGRPLRKHPVSVTGKGFSFQPEELTQLTPVVPSAIAPQEDEDDEDGEAARFPHTALVATARDLARSTHAGADVDGSASGTDNDGGDGSGDDAAADDDDDGDDDAAADDAATEQEREDDGCEPASQYIDHAWALTDKQAQAREGTLEPHPFSRDVYIAILKALRTDAP